VPLTPFHLGPALLLGLIFLNYLDLPTFLIANIILDVEPILVILLSLNYQLHGFFHSFLGGTIVAFILVWLMTKIRPSLDSLLKFFRLEQKSSFNRIFASSFLGIYIHILLDSRMHHDIRPFFPLESNPFLDRSALAGLEIYMLTTWCFMGAAIIYGIRLFLTWRKNIE